MLIFGLTLILIPAAARVDRFCRFNQSYECNAAVGDKLTLQMVLDARGVDLQLYKGPSGSGLTVLKVHKSKETVHESIRNRSEFIRHDWTLIINSVITEDSGDYRLEVYDTYGTIIPKQHLQVYIEDPLVFEVCVLLWCFQMMVLLGLLGGFHIYMRHTAGQTRFTYKYEERQDDDDIVMFLGKTQDDQNLRRFDTEMYETSAADHHIYET